MDKFFSNIKGRSKKSDATFSEDDLISLLDRIAPLPEPLVWVSRSLGDDLRERFGWEELPFRFRVLGG